MTDVTAPVDGPAPADGPAPVDRLDPAARPYADALASFFPDLGGCVTDAGEARRILAAVPATARPAVVGAVEDREVPGQAGALRYPFASTTPPRSGGRGPGRPWCSATAAAGSWRSSLNRRRGNPELATVIGDLSDNQAGVADVQYDVSESRTCSGGREGRRRTGMTCQTRQGDLGGNLPASAGRELQPCLDAAQATGSYRSNAEGCFLTAAHLRWCWEQYLGPDGDGGDPLASPLAGDPRGLPPAYVVVAGCDPLRDEGEAYHHRLPGAGVRSALDSHPGMFHGFLALAGVLPEACQALA